MTSRPDRPASATSLAVRDRLVEALKLDLVGPWSEHQLAAERLHAWEPPSRYYLTGFLIPTATPIDQRNAADEDDDLDVVPDDAGLTEESTAEEKKAAKKGFFPSSMGVSFLLEGAARAITVTARWGDYARSTVDGEGGKPLDVWQRTPREEVVEIALASIGTEPVAFDVPRSDGLQLTILLRAIPADELIEHLPSGTRSASVFLVNRRSPNESEPDRAFAFQPEIEVESDRPFVPRPDLRGACSTDPDDKVSDLHYADTPEFATGHGVSAEWDVVDRRCSVIRTAWIPSAEVEQTKTVPIEGVDLEIEKLGALSDGAAVNAALGPIVTRYREWIAARRGPVERLPNARRETAEALLAGAEFAATRIERGIALLAKDADALDAFRVANRAVARALRRRSGAASPQWRAFQLAFILLNLPGLADPLDPHREIVDLLFFPTGGGKTEAYLGLAAFAMVLRRLHHPGEKGRAGVGVSVIMRYTLRLLTLDQLSRAAALVCALEIERAANAARYGEWPFEIGLWVGKAATPNVLGKKGDGRQDTARSKTKQYKANPKGRPSPIPLEACPWCGTAFGRDSFALIDDTGRANEDYPTQLRILCTNLDCEFIRDRTLPIVAVDEPLYRRLPAFLIATVDKFASLPWVGPSGALLGGGDRHDATGFYGAAEPGRGRRLTAPLPPPDLVIQDELHLISGPLGTMAGLYETAIEGLCTREVDGRAVRPKIVASTATARRAQEQIEALFGRSMTQVFPPPGPDRGDSFFARTVPSPEVPARLYVGIASPGRNPKVLLRKAWLALMGAAERAYRDAGGHKNSTNPADPYMTVLGYFNSLRELGGARRILEEEVRSTIQSYGKRKRVGETFGLFQDRKTFAAVMELTSRVPTHEVAEARAKLALSADERDRVDCAIATNMISVGLDIQRLGLMVVFGQPKTHSEYIQATSRVGRDDARPGLVVTLLNVHKPRDRSHYERFRHYHETFYRSVEVASVTPFSARALDRGFAGALVGFARHADARLTPAEGAAEIAAARADVERRLREAFLERVRRQPLGDEDEREQRLDSVQRRIGDLLDSWQRVYEDYRSIGARFQYQKYEETGPKPLLREMLEQVLENEHHKKFRANRSLRDVEPEVNLFIDGLKDGSES